MSKYTNNSGVKVIYDDPVTCRRRQFLPGETFWAQSPGTENLPTGDLTVDDLCDHYGVRTRREFVEGADIGVDYVAGSEGLVKVLDEFIGVGESQPLTDVRFKRTIFYYRNATYPTQWTEIFETYLLEGQC